MNLLESTNKAVYYAEVLEYFGISMYIFRKILRQNTQLSHIYAVKRRRYFTPKEFETLKKHFWQNENNEKKTENNEKI